jgi:hypothetical protein
MRADLGKERWAELVDPDDLTHGAKLRVQALLKRYDDENEHTFLVGMAIRDKLIAECVTSWSFEFPPPAGDPAKLEPLPGSAYEALRGAVEPHYGSLDFVRAAERVAAISSASRTSSEDTSSLDTSRPSEPSEPSSTSPISNAGA